MREQALRTPAKGADPIRGTADAMGSAVQAIKQGASDVQARISDSIPEVGGFLSRMIYKSSYMLSYGVVFPVMLVVRVVPKNNAMVHGFVDGAVAARDTVAGWRADRTTGTGTDSTAHESLESENGSMSDGKAAEETGHPRRRTRRTTSHRTAPKRSTRKS
jgi:hypothetical protein